MSMAYREDSSCQEVTSGCVPGMLAVCVLIITQLTSMFGAVRDSFSRIMNAFSCVMSGIAVYSLSRGFKREPQQVCGERQSQWGMSMPFDPGGRPSGGADTVDSRAPSSSPQC